MDFDIPFKAKIPHARGVSNPNREAFKRVESRILSLAKEANAKRRARSSHRGGASDQYDLTLVAKEISRKLGRLHSNRTALKKRRSQADLCV